MSEFAEVPKLAGVAKASRRGASGRTRFARRIATSALVLAAGFALAACATDEGGATGSTSTPEVLPPVMVQLDEIDGTTVEVPITNVIVLQGDDTTFTAWEADIADPSVAEFTPGRDDGSAQFDPGITPLKIGETEVALNNTESGDSLTFTVKVVETR
ncbi:hypothetical protein ET445_03215 [Agromyces protaetiae]|uniref:MSP domain-containing protein n=1 Tax=Agromyces protaetiae TaxID=2509455 RepID=A0A4P6FA81_9MICO|nr:hypothetical protein [Agromyces protaetiae]QAY72496.1 hypothetical protein ET445_03215 [Agromyces protaetiae]